MSKGPKLLKTWSCASARSQGGPVAAVDNEIYTFAEGCPNECHNNGACQLFQDGWKCSCKDGWKGVACSVAMEIECENSHDEDDGELQNLLLLQVLKRKLKDVGQ